MYLVFICALLQLLELGVQYGELACDALNTCMQPPVFAVLRVEVILVALPLLRGGNHSVLPVDTHIKQIHGEENNIRDLTGNPGYNHTV